MESRESFSSVLFSEFSRFFEFSVSLFENLLVPAVQFVGRRNVADGAVQPYVVVMIDVLSYNSSRVVKGKRNPGANAFILDRLVKPLYLAVGLRIIRRRSHMRHPGNADELFEIPGDKLRPVVRNDRWPGFGELLPGPLKNDFHV